MTEEEAVSLGSFCETLIDDARFLKLMDICEADLTKQMLGATTAEERENVHRSYLGLKEVVNIVQQFVLVKDQIIAKNESETD